MGRQAGEADVPTDEYVSSTRLPELTEQLRTSTPMSPIYIAPEDVVAVSTYNIAPDLRLAFYGRLLLPTGRTVTLEQQLTLTTGGVLTTQVIPIAEGYLLSAGVRVVQGPIARGQCYVQILLIRGRLVETQQYAYLVTGYVDWQQTIMWPWAARNEAVSEPPGFQELIVIPPVAGGPASVTVPAWRQWRLNGVHFGLQTDATVADRIALFSISRAGVFFVSVASGFKQTASLPENYEWSPGLAMLDTGLARIHHQGIPADIVLRGGDVVTLNATNIAAGDAWFSISLRVESFSFYP